MPVHFIQSPGTVIQRPADFHLDRACRNAVSGSDDRMPFTPQTRRNQDFALPIGQLAQDQGKRAKLIAIFGLSGGSGPSSATDRTSAIWAAPSWRITRG